MLAIISFWRGATAPISPPVRVADAATAPTFPVLAAFERDGDQLTFAGWTSPRSRMRSAVALLASGCAHYRRVRADAGERRAGRHRAPEL